MRTLTRWNPLRDMTRFDPFGDVGALWSDLPMAVRTLEPEPMMRLDLTESETGYVVKAEIPGVSKEDISVSLEGGTVSITAEARREKAAKEGETVMRSERYYGVVSRSFTLPTEIDMAKSIAAYEGGVLTLTLPKAPGGTSTKLAVH
ncbi:MAG TPA: Hsp20/alpha crystallin family protein [Casimicrobiaceae bacterium]|nr:Hsp20/alpha crystallin family protein [Casimicrobiaceae bacterium]